MIRTDRLHSQNTGARTAPTKVVRAALYLRISQDRHGRAEGVERQEADCRRLAERNGWTVVATYDDNDFSAFSGRKRPGYQAMLQAIREDRVDAVVVYDQDRLDKGGLEGEQFIQLADAKGIRLASVGGDFDLSTDNGRLQYRIKAAVSRAELERKSARQKDANAQRARKGLLHMAGRKSFGYAADGRTPDPVEKAAVVEAAGWLLDRISLREVARRWNAAGLTTATGKPWQGELVSQFFTNPRLAGIRTYLREPVLDDDGQPVRGDWEPLLDDDTWTALHTLLTDPSRRWPQPTAQLLLSGVARCGVCGARINSGGTRQGNARAGHRYRCSGPKTHVNRTAAPVDKFVADVLIARLSEPDVAEHLVEAEEHATVDLAALRTEVARIHAKLTEVANAWADDRITTAQRDTSTERLRQQLAQVEAQQGAAIPRSPATVKLATAPDVAIAWAGLDTEVRRQIIRELMDIELFGPGAGIRYVTEDHVQITWK